MHYRIIKDNNEKLQICKDHVKLTRKQYEKLNAWYDTFEAKEVKTKAIISTNFDNHIAQGKLCKITFLTEKGEERTYIVQDIGIPPKVGMYTLACLDILAGKAKHSNGSKEPMVRVNGRNIIQLQTLDGFNVKLKQ